MKIFLNGNELVSNVCSIGYKDVDYTDYTEINCDVIEQKNINIYNKVSEIVHRIGNYAKNTYFTSRGTQMFAGVVGVNDASFYNILTKLQDFSFYIAVGWATWGIIEYILDKPEGVEKIKRAVWGYIGINAIPTLFAMIRDTFRMVS